MKLTTQEKEMLEGKYGKAARKSMEILTTLGEIFNADRMVGVTSVQIAGVSYDNLGEAGLEFLNDMAEDGKIQVLTTLNPAGMDRDNWKVLGINEDFAINQNRVIDAFAKMENVIRELPVKLPKGSVRHRYFYYLLIRKDDTIFIRQRGEGDIWTLLYEFPLIESDREMDPGRLLKTKSWKNAFSGKEIQVVHFSGEYRHVLSHQ
ncbi:MAG: aconitase X, partial [Candidatus Thorarchaeota archaeon]